MWRGEGLCAKLLSFPWPAGRDAAPSIWPQWVPPAAKRRAIATCAGEKGVAFLLLRALH